ncbi:MAG TPA: hypothetical protein ENG16_01065 [Archaeoglobus sp.]|nr:hypothetical protein [Archaeoglobus sp.]
MLVLEPLKKAIVNHRAVNLEEITAKKFGGFCSCGGVMFQKSWVRNENREILISECERCWKIEALVFNSRRFVRKEDVIIIKGDDFVNFLRDFLSESEFEAVIGKAKGNKYKPTALSRAKKRLSNLNLNIDEVLTLLK